MEYVLTISVLVIAMWAAAQVFVDPYKNGLAEATGDIKKMVNDGYVGGGNGGR